MFKYLKGYVYIKITGFSIERFLNLCLNKNIVLYDLEERSDGLICKVDIKDFKSLKEISRKTACKYKIVSKYGLPFFIFKNKKRIFFIIGIMLFIFLLYFFSSFVWNIEIKGNDKVDNNEILRFCEKNNLYLGAYKNKIDTKELQTKLKNNFPEISWANVQIKGTNVKINISENITEKKELEFKNPCDIIATETGVITEIVTKTGRPLVKEKDIVKKGDILVSGELFLKDGENIVGSYYAYSDADIKAKVKKSFSITLPYSYKDKQYTGKQKTSLSLIAFNKTFSFDFFNKIPFENYDTKVERIPLKLSDNFYLPFIIKKTTYKEYKPINKKYSIKDANLVINKLINEKIISDINFSSDILEKNISYKQNKNELIATVDLTIIQEIGKQVPISSLERSNEEYGTNENSNR